MIFLEKDIGRGGQSWGGVCSPIPAARASPAAQGTDSNRIKSGDKSASAAEPKQNKIPN